MFRIPGGGGSDGGVLTVANVGSSPNAAGASITGTALTLQPADGSNPGVVTTGAQTIAGAKTFSGAMTISSASGLTFTGITSTTNAIDLGTDNPRIKGGSSANGWIQFNSGAFFFGNHIQSDTGRNITHGAGAALGSTAGQTTNLQGSPADGATAVSVVLRSANNFTTAGAKIVSIRNNTSAEVVAFPWEGSIRLNVQGTARPAASAARRGEIFYVPGGAGVSDTIEICLKDAADAYAWVSLV